MILKLKESLSSAASRANSYKLLSECYFLPDQNLLKIIESIDHSWDDIFRKLKDSMPTLDALKVLTLDYSKLFFGPFKVLASPYGSVYLDGKVSLVGESTLEVEKFYQSQGLKISLKEVPDHIAIELEFMYYLVTKEIAALKGEDHKGIESCRQKQFIFLSKYLGSWIDQFSKGIQKSAQTEFYITLAKISQSFIAKDLKTLGF
jgi:TorA maturation chaperone TorD